MTGENVGALTVFRTTVEVMLRDGVLTREEKRLIIKLANALGLSPEEPAEIYSAIREGRESESGRESRPMNRDWSTQEFSKLQLLMLHCLKTNSLFLQI